MLLKILIGRIVSRSTSKGAPMALIQGEAIGFGYTSAVAFGDVAEYYLETFRDGDEIEALGDWKEYKNRSGDIERSFKIDRLPYSIEKKRKKRTPTGETLNHVRVFHDSIPTLERRGMCVVLDDDGSGYCVMSQEHCMKVGTVKVRGGEISKWVLKIDYVLDVLGVGAVSEAISDAVTGAVTTGTEAIGICDWHKVCAPEVRERYRGKLSELVQIAQIEEVQF